MGLQSVLNLGKNSLAQNQVALQTIAHHIATAGARALPDALQPEALDELLARDHDAVFVERPAEQPEEVEHRFRQVTLVAVLQRGLRAVALAELRFGRPDHDRQVDEGRRLPAERLVGQEVARRARYPLVAPEA